MNRLDLHKTLCDILGTKNVYFQPPENIKINYPAIVYSFDNIKDKKANNGVYLINKRYMVTLIDRNPESPLMDKLIMLPKCRFSRNYQSDNLYHYVFEIYI